MDTLERFRLVVEEIAGTQKIGFCLGDEVINPDIFFDYNVGLPIACIPGLEIAKITQVSPERMLVKLQYSDDHPAYCALEKNPLANGQENAALMTTLMYVSTGLTELSKQIEPRIVQGGVNYLAVEDIAKHVEENQKVAKGQTSSTSTIAESSDAVWAAMRSVELNLGDGIIGDNQQPERE